VEARPELTVGMAQIASASGDVAANLERHLRLIDEAQARGVDLLVFPELSLSGCDVLGHMPAVARTLEDPELLALAERSRDLSLVVGFVERAADGGYYNALVYLEDGVARHVHRKVYLVTADGISERRIFSEGRSVRAFATRFGPLAMLNCEDAWHLPMPYLAVMDGARLLLTCAATPYGPPTQLPSDELWLTINRAYAIILEAANVFVNRSGAEGSLRFFGGSHVVAATGEVLVTGPEEECVVTQRISLDDVLAQRFEVSYVRDERLALTARELGRLLGKDPHGPPGG
jgi:predicted amidohydrolase